ncbi:HupE/UreJ family protein [Methylocystis sp.]|uniref:HupE/UreJ family protein n=1 Tax=Methylocystis sp. TaxID=1911079 RepID=UPI003D11ECAE
MWLRLILCALAAQFALLLQTPSAHAHLSSDSYLHVDIDAGGRPSGQWDISLRDLDAAIGLAGDDGVITWGGLKARRAAIEAYAFDRLSIDGCALRPSDMLVDRHAGAAHAVLRFKAECQSAPAPRRLHYRLLFDLDPTHRGLLTLATPAGERSEVLSPERADIALDRIDESTSGSFLHFVGFGVSHILFGYDHLLFVAVLMIFAAFRRGESGWTPLDGFGASALQTLTILTAFTLAHGVTLTLSLFHFIDAPARFVEPAVAATIMGAAIDNLLPLLSYARWTIAFGFGLVHGLAFATALGPMRLSTSGLLYALAGFNGGVELGQIAVASLLMPLVFTARRKALYVSYVAPALTALAFILALVWFVDRIEALL